MKRWVFLIVCLFSASAFALDEVRRIEINGINSAQAKTAMDWIYGLDLSGTASVAIEHTPVAGNPEIGQNVFRINVVGPDIAAFVTRVRNEVQAQLGRPPDVDVAKTADLQAIKDAWLLHGPSLANRPALKAAIVAIWKDGARCMSGDDARTLKAWLRKKGIRSRKELKDWLNET